MRTSRIAVVLLGLGIAAATAALPVLAQSGLEMQKRLSKEPNATDEFFKDDGKVLEDRLGKEIDTSPADFGPPAGHYPAPLPAANIEPFKAEGGSLTLLNCGTSGISVKTFNGNDGVMWVPFQTVNVGSRQRSGLRCATSSCKLQVGGLKTGAVSGYQVYINGRVRATNKAAMDKGCSVYN